MKASELIKEMLCSRLGHKIINPEKINGHVWRFSCKRCGGDFALNLLVEGGLLPWEEVKELYENKK